MLVTVLMSVYNSGLYLEKAIHSILSQTYKEFEFIIIDDGSTDNSKQICRAFMSIDPRIVFIENERNLGLAASLNKGILSAKGRYIARQDADDFSAPDRLETQLKYALEHEHVDLIGSDCFVVDIFGEVVWKDDTFSKRKSTGNDIFEQKALFPHGSAFLKKGKLVEAGLYDARFYYVQDGEFWKRLIAYGAQVVVLDKPLYYYRATPVACSKRGHAKRLYNNVLRLAYIEKKPADVIDKELDRIQDYLMEQEAKPHRYYMARYWKGLGNTAYMNNRGRRICFNYIKKAVKETNSLTNYIRYVILLMVYVIPPHKIKPLLRHKVPA